jgi:hypothetical protein
MTLQTVEWLTATCFLALTGRAIYLYMEWRWRARQIRANDQWLAHRERERKAAQLDDNRAVQAADT